MGRGGKKNVGAAGALFLMGFLALYLSGIYSWMMGEMFLEAGVIEFLIPVMSLFAVVLSLAFTMMSAGGTVFGGKDTDFMLSLPVSAFFVVLSKMTALYLENLMFVGLWMIPTGIAGFAFGAASGWGYFVRLLFAVVALPFFSSFAACLGGWGMTFAASRMKHKALAANLISVLLFLSLFLGSLQINSLGTVLLANRDRAEQIFSTWLLPFGLLGRGLAGEYPAFLGSLLVCTAPFLAVTWLLSGKYKQILSGLSAHGLRTDFKLKKIQTKRPSAALFQKEVNRLFSTPAYLMNCGISVVLLLGFAVYLLADRETTALFVSLLGEKGMAPLLLACAALLLSMIYPSSVSLSLEGKTLWILKEAPVSAAEIFAAKSALNLVLAWPAALAALVLFAVAGNLPVRTAGCMLLVCLTLTALLGVAGVAVNLHFPKLDCDSDVRVVKNSASAMICSFGSLIFTLLLAGLWALTRKLMPFEVFCLALSFMLAVLTAFVWRYLTRRGVELFSLL